LRISDAVIPATLLRLVCDTAAVRRGLETASAFASTRALNNFTRLGWRELKRRERRGPGAARRIILFCKFGRLFSLKPWTRSNGKKANAAPVDWSP
jgi:hypothetical protein